MKKTWGALVPSCCVALVGCGDDAGGAQRDEVEPRRNIVVKTVYPDGCLPRALGVNYSDGWTRGNILEATAAPCDCSRPGRAAAASDEIAAVREELAVKGVCGGSTEVACSGYCGCRILELAGSSSDSSSPLYACQNLTTVNDTSLVGYCYIEPGRVDENGMPAPLGNPELLAGCESGYPARIRFIGADTPLPGANLFVVYGSTSNPVP